MQEEETGAKEEGWNASILRQMHELIADEPCWESEEELVSDMRQFRLERSEEKQMCFDEAAGM